MENTFENQTIVPISSGAPSKVQSAIEATGMSGVLRDVNVRIDVEHSYTSDLRITLEGPGGQSILLVGAEGGAGDHFQNTAFDDAALESVQGKNAPFTGIFRPEESLSLFNGAEPNGTWILKVEDQAFQDGGSLNSWELTLETGGIQLVNDTPVAISPGAPNTVESTVAVSQTGGDVLKAVRVQVDLDHTWDDDLTLTLISPMGTRVTLVDREGGGEDGFKNTLFDDTAAQSITTGSAPFTGTFQPEGKLADLAGELAAGTWALEIQDRVSADGGTLNRWTLELDTKPASTPETNPFQVDVRFLGGLSANQRSVFLLAAQRWAQIITEELPPVSVRGEVVPGTNIDEVVQNVVIYARGEDLGGVGGILGQAGPVIVRSGTNLPAVGIMSFDIADLGNMEANGSLVNVVIHEMGHVLGIGTLWARLGLVAGSGTNDPEFTGTYARQAYTDLTTIAGRDVPLANQGGAGTAEGHWRESVFGQELMTGYLDEGVNPLSNLTIASLRDIGYSIDMDAADPFALPSLTLLGELNMSAQQDHHCRTVCPTITVAGEHSPESGSTG